MFRHLLLLSSLVLIGLFVFNDIAFAGTDMPYEQALEKFKDSLTGPVGVSVAVIALFVAGSMFVFGGELGGLAKTLVGVCIAIGIMLGGNIVITKLFSKSSSGNLVVYTQEILSDKISEWYPYE